MNDSDKIAVLETAIYDLQNVIQTDFEELNVKYDKLTDYEKGQWMSLKEVSQYISERIKYIEEMFDDI